MGYFRNVANAVLGQPASGYNAATNGRRMFSVGSSTRSTSSLALSDGAMLTSRVRKLAMDNPMAANGIRTFIEQVVGTGIRPHSKHKDEQTRLLLESEFFLWCDQSSSTRRTGPDGKPDSMQNWFTQQQLIVRNCVEAGEAFARLRYRFARDLSATGLRVPLQIELIEPEQLAYWRSSAADSVGTNLVRGSIEFNDAHERVAYHFYREHPGDSAIWPNAFEVVRVPAGSVLHVMEFIRGNQIRGITPLAPVISALAEVDEFDDATRLRQKLGAFLFAWKKSITPDDGAPFNPQTTAGYDTAAPGTNYVEAQPGMVTALDANLNEEFGFYAPPGVTDSYESFMKIQHHTLATAMRISYDMLTGDVSNANYSSSRVRLIALHRAWEQYQKSVIVHQFCRSIWRAWLDAAALAGVIDASDYARNPSEYLNVEWLAQPWEWVDPKTDVESVRLKIEACLSSRSTEVAKLGRDVRELDSEIASDKKREKEMGIQPVYGTSRVTIPDTEDVAASDTATAPAKKKAPANGGKTK